MVHTRSAQNCASAAYRPGTGVPSTGCFFRAHFGGRGESGWCSDVTSTHGAWRHAGVQFLLLGAEHRPFAYLQPPRASSLLRPCGVTSNTREQNTVSIAPPRSLSERRESVRDQYTESETISNAEMERRSALESKLSEKIDTDRRKATRAKRGVCIFCFAKAFPCQLVLWCNG